MNNHVNPTIADVLKCFCGMKKYRVWFNYLGLRLDAVLACYPGEEEDCGRAMVAAKYNVSGESLKFEKAEDMVA